MFETFIKLVESLGLAGISIFMIKRFVSKTDESFKDISKEMRLLKIEIISFRKELSSTMADLNGVLVEHASDISSSRENLKSVKESLIDIKNKIDAAHQVNETDHGSVLWLQDEVRKHKEHFLKIKDVLKVHNNKLKKE